MILHDNQSENCYKSYDGAAMRCDHCLSSSHKSEDCPLNPGPAGKAVESAIVSFANHVGRRHAALLAGDLPPLQCQAV